MAVSMENIGVAAGELVRKETEAVREERILQQDENKIAVEKEKVAPQEEHRSVSEDGDTLDVSKDVYVAGAAMKDGTLVTNGGRVLGCIHVADSLPEAIKGAYAVAEQVHFENAFFRHDIGARAMKAYGEAK